MIQQTMHIHNLSLNNSLLNTFVSEIRNVDIQKDRMRFRRNIERIGEILAYEMSKVLTYYPSIIETPLGKCQTNAINREIVICSILRAGIPLHNGLLNYFDTADNAFISAYRQHLPHSDEFNIVTEYLSCPDLTNKTLIVADPMLATGRSIIATYEVLKPFGKPKEIHLISVIGAQEGVNRVMDHFDASTHLWIAAIDETLNNKGYIIPGLGDAGDLSYGEKLQK